jgi:heptosyltransferase-1
MRVLLVKMSSLGDVVHTLPAVSDAAAHGVEFDWVVEEAFAAIPSRHPAVRQVLPIAWRRWRRSLMKDRGALAEFLQALRSDRYDVVLDAQGLAKSAIVTRLAHAPIKAGPAFSSAREGVAALFYNRRIDVPTGRHAVDRLRTLFAEVFGYALDDLPETFNLEAATRPGSRQCVLLHGTTWPSKLWPERMWRSLAGRLIESGWEVQLPWGNPEERKRAEDIASGLSGATVLEQESLGDLGRRITDSALVIGADSGLAHLAAASGVPTVVLYGATSAELTGARGARVVNLRSDLTCSPCLARDCRYRGSPLEWQGEAVNPPCYARITPEKVWEEAMKLLERQG